MGYIKNKRGRSQQLGYKAITYLIKKCSNNGVLKPQLYIIYFRNYKKLY